MNKAVLAHVDSGVGGDVALGKEDQIAGLYLVFRHRLSPTVQVGYGAGRGNVRAGQIDMADQPAAVKARIRRVASKAIRRSHEPKGVQRDVVGLPREQA